MSARMTLPDTVAFLDVETTGLGENDRIVSIGAVWVAARCLRAETAFPFSYIHLIFNPGRPCSPRAAAVHGYSDWLLRHQDPFSAFAPEIARFLSADLLVAHNASFDIGFVDRELQSGGAGALKCNTYCTMEGWRVQHGEGSLEAVCRRLQIPRRGDHHGALEDAWLCMNAYLSLQGRSNIVPFSSLGPLVEPFNIRAAPAEAPHIEQSSNTGRGNAPTTAEAQRIDDLVNEIKRLKRAGQLQRAEEMLLAEVMRQETSARATGFGVAPWYYEQLAIVYAKQKRWDDELSILQRYDQQPKAPGVMPAVLKERLARKLERYGQA